MATSDTHTYLKPEDVPDGDIFIHAGDGCVLGDRAELMEFVRVLALLRDRFKKIIFVPGNHDQGIQQDERIWRAVFQELGMVLLIHEPYEFAGVKFFGSPWTPKFMDWAYMYEKERADLYWRDIPDDTDILVTHGMPHGVLDRVGPQWGTAEHVGCPSLREWIEFYVRPKLFIGGHLHRDGGQQMTVGKTACLNVAMCDEAYHVARKPVVIKYERTSS